MLSHVTVGTRDFERDLVFWTAMMALLGIEPRFTDRSRPWAGWQPAGGGRPLFLLTAPYDGATAEPGNGPMIAFLAQDRATVRAAHALGLAQGGRDEGPPGLRPEYHAHYYGTYLRDPSGNKFAVVCHAPEDPSPAAH